MAKSNGAFDDEGRDKTIRGKSIGRHESRISRKKLLTMFVVCSNIIKRLSTDLHCKVGVVRSKAPGQYAGNSVTHMNNRI